MCLERAKEESCMEIIKMPCYSYDHHVGAVHLLSTIIIQICMIVRVNSNISTASHMKTYTFELQDYISDLPTKLEIPGLSLTLATSLGKMHSRRRLISRLHR